MSPIEIAWTVVGVIIGILITGVWSFAGMTPPEFRNARICLNCSAALLGGMEIVWYAQTGYPFYWRVAVACLICLTIGIGLPEGLRWIQRRELKAAEVTLPPPNPPSANHIGTPASSSAPPSTSGTPTESPHKVLPPPLKRRKAFSTIIPFAIDSFHAGIPYNSNNTDPLQSTYTELAGISDLPSIRTFDQSSGKLVTPKISDADIENFLGHVMQYYILRTLNEIQNPVTYMSYESGKGTSTVTNSPISVPDEKEYPNEKLFKLFEKLNLQFGNHSGPNDWIWKQFKMKVPSGTNVDFVEVADAGKKNYIVRFERAPDLLLDFRIELTARNQGQGTFPKNFVPASPGQIQDAYAYIFTIHDDLQWRGDHSVGQDYVEWANGLEAGMRKKLVIP